MSETTLVDLLRKLQRIVNEDGTEWPAPWKQVPEEVQKDFMSWVGEVKQQTWEGMWETGWSNYQHEYIRFLIDQCLLEVS